MPPDANSPAPPLHDPSSLLQHVGWVRELAQRLVRDPHAADDLTQETMLAAIENRGAEARSPRAWLGRVLRNVLWEQVRQNRRREARERATAKVDSAVSSAELVEKVDTHRTLVDAVLRLPEHYRTMLLRRYFEGETPTQIAAALDMPISTVKTRLQRGLERMRGELDEAYGKRERWQPALIGLIGLPRRAALAPVPLMLAITLLLSGVVAVAWSMFADPAIAPPPASETAKFIPTPASGKDRAAADLPARHAAPGHDATVVEWGSIKMPSQPVRGTTVTPDGKPIGGVFLRFDPDGPPSDANGTTIVISNPDGTFEMMVARSGRVVAIPGELATLCPGVIMIASKEELRVVVTDAKSLTGIVLDEHNNPLAFARILVGEPPAMRGLLGATGTTAEMALHEVTTGSRGTFAFEQVPLSPGSRILVRREGFVDQEISWQGQSRLDITLVQPPASEHEANGFVLSPDGAPISDARVACGTSVTRSNRTGAFRLPLPELPEGMGTAHLLATAPGFGAAIVSTTSLDKQRHPQWRAGIELRLTESPLSLKGRVLRADGSPAVGARVWLTDPTLFGHRVGSSMTTSIYSERETAMSKFWPETIEALQSTGGELEAVRTDSEGRFVLDGLCARSYQLVAYEFATSLRSPPTRVTAGDDAAELRLGGDVIAKLQGVVVDQRGDPVAGVNVALWSDLMQLRWGDRPIFSMNHVRGAMRTGPDGSFWLFDVPGEGVTVYFSGNSTLPTNAAPALEPMRIVVQRISLMSVTCADTNAVDSVAGVDHDDRPVLLSCRRGNSTFQSRRLPMLEGSAETFALPDEVVAIVGYLDGKEVRRTQLQPNMRTITW